MPARNGADVFSEPLRVTLARTFTIAICVALVVAASGPGLRSWPALTLVMLWPAFGGHWIDLFFLNWLRPRLPDRRPIQLIARLGVWFAGGILLGIGARSTASLVLVRPRIAWLTWAVAGMMFIAIELVAHAALQLRGRPNFYDGRG